MAPIGFVLVSLAATISILATTKRSRSIIDCVFRKILCRQILAGIRRVHGSGVTKIDAPT
jgi:hypothetical protein